MVSPLAARARSERADQVEPQRWLGVPFFSLAHALSVRTSHFQKTSVSTFERRERGAVAELLFVLQRRCESFLGFRGVLFVRS